MAVYLFITTIIKQEGKKNKFVHSTMLGENVLCGFRLSFIVTKKLQAG